MDAEPPKKPLKLSDIEEAIKQISGKPKRRYTQQEIDEARGNLVLLNDRVFFVTFCDNKNNPIITDIVNALRKIHDITPIPPLERTILQNASLYDVLGRGMIGDLFGEGALINIAIEAQKTGQDGYAVRGTITSSNAMRFRFNSGDDFTEAPDVVTVNILGFKLPELANRKMFVSRIVRAEYDSKEPFLAEKYSEYYIEIPKLDDWTKEELPEEYHDIFDICCIFRAKIKDHGEVIKVQTIANPTALKLSEEVKKAVAPNEFVNETLERKNELEQLRDYILMREQKAAEREQKAAAVREATVAEKAAEKTAEKMILTAIQSNVPSDAVEAMRKNAGITEVRLAELRNQAQVS